MNRSLISFCFILLFYLQSNGQRGRNVSRYNGIDISLSRLVPDLFNTPDHNFLFHESISYSRIVGQHIRAYAGINFLAPAKDGVTRYGFHVGFNAGSKNPEFGILYGPTFFHMVNKTAYDNGALRNYHNTGLAFGLGIYYVPVSQIVFSSKIAPAIYHYNFKKKNDIPVVDNNNDTRSQTFYLGFYNLISFSAGYRF
mgnify:CR=1 FL=1